MRTTYVKGITINRRFNCYYKRSYNRAESKMGLIGTIIIYKIL